MNVLTDITFHGRRYVPNPSSSQGNSNPLQKDWFVLLRTILQFKVEAFFFFFNGGGESRLSPGDGRMTAMPSSVWGFKESRAADLTLHRRARGLGEERDEQEVDEVDEGQGIVPEQASCRKQRKKRVKQQINNNKRLFKHQSCKRISIAHYITFNNK